jgi:tetratricopeptide (TPR) repeat protein
MRTERQALMNGRARRGFALVVVAAWLAGCAPPPPPPAPGAPQFPNFLFPTVPESLAGLPSVTAHVQAWRRLQAGDLPSATAGFADALGGTTAFYPSEVGLGYVDVAARRFDDALARFAAVLDRVPAYAPAWVGSAEALLASRREGDALAAYESALAADPGLSDVRRRVEVLRFRSVQDALETARLAEGAERFGEAQLAYERALAVAPDSGVLYRGLAAAELRLGDLGQALDHIRRANELEPDDAGGLTLQGEIHETLGDLEGAEAAFARAARVDPAPERRARLERVRRRLAAVRLPPAYRAIPDNPRITRAELASVVGVRLERLVADAPRGEAVLITDTRTHWADRWILAVAQAGVMEVFANHTFQPESVVDRGELALVVSRVLTLIAQTAPGRGAAWQTARYPFSDLEPGHLRYPAASMAVASEVLPVLDGNRFGLSNVVTGREALAALDRLERLAGP